MSVEILAWLFCQVSLAGKSIPTWTYHRIYAPAFLSSLLVTHALLCAAAGFYAAFRVFVLENLRQSFELLQLLPLSPARWLLGKLAFPAFSYSVAVLAGVPFYYLAAGCKLIRVESVGFFLQQFALAGVVMLLVTLLVTPEYLRMQRSHQKAQLSGNKLPSTGFALWGSLQGIIGFVTGIGLFFGKGLSLNQIPFFDSTGPEYLYWLAGIGAVTPAAWLTGVAAIQPYEKPIKRAAIARNFAVLVLYLGVVASLWPIMPAWFHLGALLAIPTFILYGVFVKPDRADDPYSTAEVHWVAKHWDIPLLIHDLRVFARHRSVRGTWMLTAFWTLVLTGFLIGTSQYIGLDDALVFAGLLIFLGSLIWSASCWGRSRMFWMKEWSEGTLQMLCLTPLTEKEIVLGRIAAVPVYFGAGLLPFLIPAAGCLAWIWISGSGHLIPAALSQTPLLISMGLWSSVQTAPTGLQSLRHLIGNWRQWGIRILQTVVCLETLFLISSASRSNRVMVLSWFTVIGIANLILCRAWFQLRVDQLKKFRETGLESYRGGQPPSAKPRRLKPTRE